RGAFIAIASAGNWHTMACVRSTGRWPCTSTLTRRTGDVATVTTFSRHCWMRSHTAERTTTTARSPGCRSNDADPWKGAKRGSGFSKKEDSTMNRKTKEYELVCCAGCGRDTKRPIGSVCDAYCARCVRHGLTHHLPESTDRRPLYRPPGYDGPF